MAPFHVKGMGGTWKQEDMARAGLFHTKRGVVGFPEKKACGASGGHQNRVLGNQGAFLKYHITLHFLERGRGENLKKRVLEDTDKRLGEERWIRKKTAGGGAGSGNHIPGRLWNGVAKVRVFVVKKWGNNIEAGGGREGITHNHGLGKGKGMRSLSGKGKGGL